MSNFSLLSHPNKLLSDHVSGVLANARTLYKNLPIPDETKRLIDICCLFHDIGKASTYFQKYMIAICDGTTVHTGDKLKNHAAIGAVWAYHIAREQGFDAKSAFFAYLCVLKHHGALLNLEEMNPASALPFQDLDTINAALNLEEYSHILTANNFPEKCCTHEFGKQSITGFTSFAFRRTTLPNEILSLLSADDFYTLSIMFSVLLSADKGECIFDGKIRERSITSLPVAVVNDYKERKFGTKYEGFDKIRQEVYESVAENVVLHNNKRFLSINVPTGIGKTLTVLNAALQLLSVRSDLTKIIYCLPFTSVIDQNAKVFEEVLRTAGIEPSSEHLLVNHHLSELRYTTGDDELSKEELSANEAEYLITSFDAVLNVTTFYQFLYGIFTGQNRDIRKLHSFANSVVILDEVQSIPIKYWRLVRETLRELAERLNITFILVTATMPLIFDEAKGEITELVANKENIFKQMSRIRLETSLLKQPMSIEECAEMLMNDIAQEPDKSRLVIVNTIKASKHLYEHLHGRGCKNLRYLSTNLPPCERLERIRTIKRKEHPYIVISTQLVEAGVDIDLDVVYRDMATLDSIFQACGRCNRNFTEGKQGIVRLLSLVNAEHQNKTFASYVYDDFDLTVTHDVLREKDIFEESEFFTLANRYFARIGDARMGKSQDDSDHILNAMAKLQYSDAFVWHRKENPRAFQIIEDDNKLPVYVMLTDKARILHDEYKNLLKKASKARGEEHFAAKHELKSCQRKMAEYIVNIRQREGAKLPDNQAFFIIADEHQDFAYNIETGVNTDTISYFHV
jgi:CRISPR-associated endonuclease/helicase Cas3